MSITKAKKMGKQIGRKRALDNDQIEAIKFKLADGEAKSTVAKEYGVSRQTLYSALAA